MSTDDLPRVAMPRRQDTWVGSDEVDVHLDKLVPPRIGRRLSMDIDELALREIGRRGVEHATKHLAELIAQRHSPDIEAAIYKHLHNSAWLQPIIKQELRRAVREFVLALWSNDEKKNMRDWFELFTAKCRETPQ